MCSIYGYIGKNYEKIDFSNDLYHRGPNDKGKFIDKENNLLLGHTRLSIIDLSNNAHQPMKFDEFVLVFNGEIYNYSDLKTELKNLGYSFDTNSDTEVVLKSYIEWGKDCVEKFRGMFAFCIYNKKENKLFLARDRFGIKPLIYGIIDKQFVFSSELKPILNSNIFTKKLNHQAVNEYFTFGSVKQPNTILKHFYTLMPSYFMEVDIKTLEYKISRYYDYVEESKKYNITTYEEAVKQNRFLLEEATKYHLVADVEVGAFLSGGVDSTAVVALMKQYNTKPINTFSVGFKNSVNVIDETEIATRSAKFLGTIHHNIKIDDSYIDNIFDDFISSIDQPSIDGINTYIVSLETSKKLKVALSGLGGDEIYGGYPHFSKIPYLANKQKNVYIIILSYLNKFRPNRFTNDYQFYGDSIENTLVKLRTINENLDFLQRVFIMAQDRKLDNLTPIQTISKIEIDEYMLNTLLRDSDVLSMANSLELRPVLLDHKLVEFAFSLKDEFKVKNGQLKSVFIDSVKDIIPKEVYTREKTGFEMPFSIWLNGILNNRFLAVSQNNKLDNIYTKHFLQNIKYKIKNKKLIRNDWIHFIFMSWIDRYGVEV